MIYKVIIELVENRTTCMDCPLCNADDNCTVQDLDFTETWSEQLATCPLEKIESEVEKAGMTCNCGICGIVNDCIANGLPERCYVNKLLNIIIELENNVQRCDDEVDRLREIILMR